MMKDCIDQFHKNGVVVIPGVLESSRLQEVIELCDQSVFDTVGTRNLLKFGWARELAKELRTNSKVSLLLGDSSNLVQCNYFSKDVQNNWYVSLHRDLSIPVFEKIDSDEWSGWSTKEGQLYAQPPRAVLESLVAIRFHLEDNDENNGALQFVPGSHRASFENSDTELCRVEAGGAVVISPLVLHKSSKLKSGKRRVLHFVFGPLNLPDGASWPA